MFQKGSFSIPSDTSGIFLSKVIQTRRCSTRRHAKTGKFLRIVVKKTKPRLIGLRKKRRRAIAIRTSHYFSRPDGLTFKFEKNALVVLKRRMNTYGLEVLGPTSREIRIKKFKLAIAYVF